MSTTSPLIRLPGPRERERRSADRARGGGRRPPAAPVGRAWINGREVGGTDRRYAHLEEGYD